MVYSIDSRKQSRWHLQLCTTLQEALGLSEPPHFLVPYYTATLDSWVDASTQQISVFAEASPLVLHHCALLNAAFGTTNLSWVPNFDVHAALEPLLLHHFHEQFPQLWQTHDLIIKANPYEHHIGSGKRPQARSIDIFGSPVVEPSRESQGFVLRLFISGQGRATEHILKRLHEILEVSLQEPYTLKVVDIHKNPEQAEINQISATPTLVKVWPPPVRKLVGDLHSVDTLLHLFVSPQQH